MTPKPANFTSMKVWPLEDNWADFWEIDVVHPVHPRGGGKGINKEIPGGVPIGGGTQDTDFTKGFTIRTSKDFFSDFRIEISDSKTQVERLNLGPW